MLIIMPMNAFISGRVMSRHLLNKDRHVGGMLPRRDLA